MNNQFAGEEVASNYVYPKGYRPKGITDQVSCLRALFPSIGFADEKLAEQPLPSGAEGWFAIPRWNKVAPEYGMAVEMVLEMIRKTRRGWCTNYLKGRLGPHRLRQHERTVAMLGKLGDQQMGHDILVAPCQFGPRHRGRSVRRAREVFREEEFGLGAFEVGIMLLTHPERLYADGDFNIFCAGDEYAPVDNDWCITTFFCFTVNRIEFANDGPNHAYAGCSSASAFLSR